MPNIAPIAENALARNARLKRAAAERSRLYRQKQKAEKAPDVRTADAAIVEAFSFVMAKHVPLAVAKNAGLPLSTASVSVIEVLAAATDILVQDGYNREKSRSAVADRVASREVHRDPCNVPSLSPHDDPGRLRPPRLWPGDPVPPALPLRSYGVPVESLASMLLDDGDSA